MRCFDSAVSKRPSCTYYTMKMARFLVNLENGKPSSNHAPVEENNGLPMDSEANANDVRPTTVAPSLAMPTSPRSDAEECPQELRRHGDRFLLLKMFRVVPDENGMVDNKGIINMARMRSYHTINVFGGERFVDYIGEMQFLTEDEQSAIVRGVFVQVQPPPPSSTPTMTRHSSATARISRSEDRPPPPYIPSPSGAEQHSDEVKSPKAPGNKRNKSRRAQQWAWACSEYRRVERERVVQQTSKLIERLRPYVESEYAGDSDDPATVAFINKVKGEAEELKKECFGAELLYLIGKVYRMKGSMFHKQCDLLSWAYSKWKVHATFQKSIFTFHKQSFVAHRSLKHMMKLKAKGKLSAEKYQALEEDTACKIMYAAWQYSKASIMEHLLNVVTGVLYEKNQSDAILYKRAEGLVIIGKIFMSLKTTMDSRGQAIF